MSCFSEPRHPSSIHWLPSGPCQCCLLCSASVGGRRAHCQAVLSELLQLSLLMSTSVFPLGTLSEAQITQLSLSCTFVSLCNLSCLLSTIQELKQLSNRLVALTDFACLLIVYSHLENKNKPKKNTEIIE